MLVAEAARRSFFVRAPAAKMTSEETVAIGTAPIRPRSRPATVVSQKPTQPKPSRPRLRPTERGRHPQITPTRAAPKMAPKAYPVAYPGELGSTKELRTWWQVGGRPPGSVAGWLRPPRSSLDHIRARRPGPGDRPD